MHSFASSTTANTNKNICVPLLNSVYSFNTACVSLFSADTHWLRNITERETLNAVSLILQYWCVQTQTAVGLTVITNEMPFCSDFRVRIKVKKMWPKCIWTRRCSTLRNQQCYAYFKISLFVIIPCVFAYIKKIKSYSAKGKDNIEKIYKLRFMKTS